MKYELRHKKTVDTSPNREPNLINDPISEENDPNVRKENGDRKGSVDFQISTLFISPNLGPPNDVGNKSRSKNCFSDAGFAKPRNMKQDFGRTQKSLSDFQMRFDLRFQI